MKKIIAFLLAAMMCLSLAACGGSNAKNTELEKETLELLNSAYDYCRAGMTYMLRAWDFSIEHSTDSTREEFDALWDEFVKHMIVTEDELVDGLIGTFGVTLEDLSLANDPSRGINKPINGMRFMNASNSIPVARYMYEHRSTHGDMDIDAELEQIKENLKQLDTESETYKLLKEYYLMVVEIREWIESPDGSYNDSFSDLTDYKKNAESYKQELDLLIG